MSLTWTDVALLFVQDSQVEGGLHVSPFVRRLLELHGLGGAHCCMAKRAVLVKKFARPQKLELV